MAEKRKKGRWGKLGQDTKSRSWLKDEYPLTNELITELVDKGLLTRDQLLDKFKQHNYKPLTTEQNLGRLARLGRDIRKREERMKNTDDPNYFLESKQLIKKWKHEAKQRKWLVNKIAKVIDISNKGGLKYQRRKDKTGKAYTSKYINLRITWMGKKHTGIYIGQESELKIDYEKLTPAKKRKFKDWREYALNIGRRKLLDKLGDRAYKTEASVLQKKLYQERLLDQF
jgi:hypothetical protein